MAFDDTRRDGEGGGGDATGDIAAVMFFLRGAAEEGLMFYTYDAREAFNAFARLLKQDPAVMWDKTGKV